jgi:D-alanine transaminase
MTRIAYVNGRFVPFADAGVHIEDRGYQFADGVYEVIAFENGRLIDLAGHLTRLERSLGELQLSSPMPFRSLELVMAEMIRRNRLASGILYLQITRGIARRDQAFPAADTPPSIVMTIRTVHGPSVDLIAKGVAVVTVPDIRWKRVDIKSVALLPNVLAKQAAKQAGAFEAWMVDQSGAVTEGSSTNAWIVSKQGELITRNATNAILNGVTRLAVMDLARHQGLTLSERPFTPADAQAAAEAFLTSTTSWVLPIVSIDGLTIGDGKPGPVSLALRQAYGAAVARQTRIAGR